jgi:hypothetical protein
MSRDIGASVCGKGGGTGLGRRGLPAIWVARQDF